jgi:hypothetical protein
VTPKGTPPNGTPPKGVPAEAPPTHRAAFHAMTPAERDALTKPLRSAMQAVRLPALQGVSRQVEGIRSTLAAFQTQTERIQHALPPDTAERLQHLRAWGVTAQKAKAAHAAILAATPIDRRPMVRRVLRDLLDPLAVGDAVDALAALHDYLTGDTFGRLFPEGRAWGLAWVFGRVIRGDVVEVADVALVPLDRRRFASGRSLRNRGRRFQGPKQRGTPKRRERYARRPVPLSNRLAAHGPPLAGAYRGGFPKLLDRKEHATA